MTSAVQPISFEKHAQTKIKPTKDFFHAKGQQVVPLIVHEFARAGAEMPIVFVKNSDNGEFQSVALLGVEDNENVYYSENGWRASYVPALVTHHPFALVPTQNDPNQLQVVIKEDSPMVSQDEGDALFEESGKESEYMEKRKNAIGKYFENTQVTQAFIKFLSEKELLEQQNLTITLNGKQHNLNGIYLVSEKQLNALSDKDFLELRQRGYLAPIYNHLSSIHQLNTIARLKTQ